VYVGNIGCETQPDVKSGASVYTSKNLFDSETLENDNGGSASSSASSTPTSMHTAAASTRSSASATATSTLAAASTTSAPASEAASATSVSSSSNNVEENDEDAGSDGLSRGAAAGIGIGLGILGIAAIVFLALFARKRMAQKQGGGGPFARMQDTPDMQQVQDIDRGATPPAAGVFVPPAIPGAAAVAAPKKSKSFKSVASKSMKSIGLTPRTSEWYYAANPKHSEDLSALPQKGWD